MTRHAVSFDCGGAQLIGTLDAGDADTGLLIVMGGSEVRAGAHRGMAELAATLAARGYPVFRFDRRGVGDSEGVDGGYRSSATDIVAALAAFHRVAPHVRRVVGFGNCDAATALVLHAADVDALVLANPWVVEASADMPPPAAVKAHYARRMRDPRAWLALAKGRIDLRALARGLRSLRAKPPAAATSLSAAFMTALEHRCVPTTLLLATGDATAIAFDAEWGARDLPGVDIVRVASSSHSFAESDDFDALVAVLCGALDRD